MNTPENSPKYLLLAVVDLLAAGLTRGEEPERRTCTLLAGESRAFDSIEWLSSVDGAHREYDVPHPMTLKETCTIEGFATVTRVSI